MSEAQMNNQTLSLHLSRVLDGIGVSDLTVNKRRQALLKIEKLENIGCFLRDLGQSKHTFGSQIEGATTKGLQSDFDHLICLSGVNVIQEVCEWKTGETNLLVVQGGDIPAGYCHLQLLQEDLPLPEIHLPNESFEYDKEGRVILTHDLKDFLHFTVNGPALTEEATIGKQSRDMVFSLKCDSMSKQVSSRISQLKNNYWPTPEMLKCAEESGFFLVPVGHRLSENRHFEWRVSPSFTERHFMLGMNITQIKCYVMLKMIKKNVIIPTLGESITSYHLKTALFHCVEETTEEFWREENLLLCIKLCLKRLLACVKSSSCPNFLIPDENLFSGKITEEHILSLQTLLDDLITCEQYEYLFGISCDMVGYLLRKSLLTPITIHENPAVHAQLELAPLKCLLSEVLFCLTCLTDNIRDKRKISQYANWIMGLMAKMREIQRLPDTRSEATSFLKFLSTIYGSLLASWCIQSKIQVSQGALSFLERGIDSDFMSGRLKYASVLLCCGRFDEAAVFLEDLKRHYKVECIQPMCICNTSLDNPVAIKPGFQQSITSCSEDSEKFMLVASHIAFSKYDVYCCPLPLRIEMFRSIGDDQNLRVKGRHDWMDLAVVDAVVYMHFLLYLTYRCLGKIQSKQQALEDFVQVFPEECQYLNHLDTAFNLLGQCYEMEGRTFDAISCYNQSIMFRPRNNAATRLLTLAIYKYTEVQKFLCTP